MFVDGKEVPYIKADFGAPGVELNLNGSADRPTYNDTKEIALTEDIEAAKEGLISYKVLEDGSKTIELANGDSLSGVNSDGVAGFNLMLRNPHLLMVRSFVVCRNIYSPYCATFCMSVTNSKSIFHSI
jgi:hypothetical protein